MLKEKVPYSKRKHWKTRQSNINDTLLSKKDYTKLKQDYPVSTYLQDIGRDIKEVKQT